MLFLKSCLIIFDEEKSRLSPILCDRNRVKEWASESEMNIGGQTRTQKKRASTIIKYKYYALWIQSNFNICYAMHISFAQYIGINIKYMCYTFINTMIIVFVAHSVWAKLINEVSIIVIIVCRWGFNEIRYRESKFHHIRTTITKNKCVSQLRWHKHQSNTDFKRKVRLQSLLLSV